MSERITEWTPVATGVNGVLLSASPNTNDIHISEANLVTFEFDHVNDGGALTITANVEVRRTNETTWRRAQTRAIAGGVETMSNRSMNKTTTAAEVAALAARWDYPVEGLDVDYVRLANITAVGAGAGDTITVRARVRRGR